MTTITKYLAEQKRLAEAATEGPWHWDGDAEQSEATLEPGVISASGMHTEGYIYIDQADAAFIAAARESVPRLVAALEAVAALHEPFEWSFGYGPVRSCKGCADLGAAQEQAEWPCPTIRAVEAALGGEGDA